MIPVMLVLYAISIARWLSPPPSSGYDYGSSRALMFDRKLPVGEAIKLAWQLSRGKF